MNNLKRYFLLDPEIIFLNHGSFGAAPRPVFEAYQEWQSRLERQPVKFLSREFHNYLSTSRAALAEYLGTAPTSLVIIPNATWGVNVVARSIKFEPGDEILTSDQEYGACEKIFEYVCERTGTILIKRPIPLPAPGSEDVVDTIWDGVTTRTKLIFLSHITSSSGLKLPVKDICRRARNNGILTLVDGAHAPGQIDLDLDALGTDFYTGNCHKWLMAPKGAGFLYTRPGSQQLIEPLIVSWGWRAEEPFNLGSAYLNNFEWMGTRDYSAFLSIPAAIQFQKQHHWAEVRLQCQELLHQTLAGIVDLTDIPSIYPDGPMHPIQMGAAELPKLKEARVFQGELYDHYRIEIPCLEWNQRQFIRVSIQGYNSQKDVAALLSALHTLLPEHTARPKDISGVGED
jgi:isopenicillin-N epimerase